MINNVTRYKIITRDLIQSCRECFNDKIVESSIIVALQCMKRLV